MEAYIWNSWGLLSQWILETDMLEMECLKTNIQPKLTSSDISFS